ncbi:tripartite tricarboxylate transporter TctB family protein [Bosea sp. (in: a-proteobacteria)]|jgi:hypothetical protein|uniref:tripartite tricarboxylate transporter TctB family protein n=1 Tax=Bosea sp. (in: a-proteobacteria) TaxID=1871050 RepID=UPI003F6F4784
MKDLDEPLPAQSPDPQPEADDPAEGMIELLAGLLFAAIGGLALYLGRLYPAGSALDMGPGYLPRLVAFGLVGIGAIGIVRGWMSRDWVLPRTALRPILWVSAAILVFAASIERLGLFFACLAAVLIAAGSEAQIRWRELPLVALLLAGFCVVLFGYVLRLAIPVWPQ